MSDVTQKDGPADAAERCKSIPFSEAFSVWLRIALLSFGGPAGQIAVMHRLLVDEKKWLSEPRFLHALNFCMLLPGPEAQQLTIYTGWLTHRIWGGVVAGMLFVLPGAVAMMILSCIYAVFGNTGYVEGLFFGLKAAVLAIVLQAVVKIGGKALKNQVMISLAILSFLAIFVFSLPFPLIILGAALIGYWGGKSNLAAFQAVDTTDEDLLEPAGKSAGWRGLAGTVTLLLVLWLGPSALLILLVGPHSVFTEIAVFFSKMAVVTFGGAYAVLAYVAQAAVGDFGWLQPGEMLDGLGMAETTPGPLIMVTQFVGFMGAYRDPGSLSPLMAGVLGGLLTTWVTFTPCFLWIFLGAPYVEKLRRNKALSSALSAITAAVVGVILNLAIWFALHVIFADVTSVQAGPVSVSMPVLPSFDPAACLLSLLALLAVFRFKLGMLPLILLAAIAGLGLKITGLV